MKTCGNQMTVGQSPPLFMGCNVTGDYHSQFVERSEAERGTCTGRRAQSQQTQCCPNSSLKAQGITRSYQSGGPGPFCLCHPPFDELLFPYLISRSALTNIQVSCMFFHAQAQYWNVCIAKELCVPKDFFQRTQFLIKTFLMVHNLTLTMSNL